MKHEDKRNIQWFCKDCGKKIEAQCKAELKRLNLRIEGGDMIKVLFKGKRGTERMWLYVEEVKGKNIIGRIRNEPVVVTELDYDSEVTVTDKTLCGFIRGSLTINPADPNAARQS
jgi:uncharacterized protein YegJ (DUF2314 family)